MSSAEPAESVAELADGTPMTREELLALLQEGIEEAADKVSNGRIRDKQRDEIRIRMWKSLAYMCRAYDDILTSQEESLDIEERLEALESAAGVR